MRMTMQAIQAWSQWEYEVFFNGITLIKNSLAIQERYTDKQPTPLRKHKKAHHRQEPTPSSKAKKSMQRKQKKKTQCAKHPVRKNPLYPFKRNEISEGATKV